MATHCVEQLAQGDGNCERRTLKVGPSHCGVTLQRWKRSKGIIEKGAWNAGKAGKMPALLVQHGKGGNESWKERRQAGTPALF